MATIVSTMSTDVEYTFYKDGGGDLKVEEHEKAVLIKGGANVIDPITMQIQPFILTEISDTELDRLLEHPVFKIHLEHGGVRYYKSAVPSGEKVLDKMTLRDKSAPKRDQDLKNLAKDSVLKSAK
jgi:hypothetical protein